MSDFSRRRFIKTATLASAAVAATGLGLFSPRSEAADFRLKFANNLPMIHPMNVRAREMAKAIKEETNGAVQIQVFPSSQLGSDTDTLAQVRSGAVDLFALSPVILGTLVPSVQISAVGFAFKDYDQVWSAMDGDLGAHVRSEIAKTDTLFAFDKMWDNGFRVTTTSTRPVLKPEDLVGMKLRVPPSPIIMSIFKAFEAAPTSINFAEVYSALQTRIVEGQENPLTLVSSAKLYEVQKYCSLTNHVWDGFWMLGNSKSFARLPADVQAVVRKHIDAAVMGQRADLAALQGSIRDTLKEKGLELADTEPQAFREQLRSANYYADWHEKFGEAAWAILEKYSGKLA
ncbi:TRAP transporter substrate-binding protein [Pseudomonas coleopterorum]|uniref:TRAP transporter substrate-binding protein n=1 Tax=Pseudomonas coleopterorum TaxID=1605838 RepID=UPI00177E0AC1|nr:TRAP transporter substrate-binding protein [Pseudomonas coleopterorum]MBD8481752.1 TRAP transporter substrate-binding protein [Pseudomonas coleopterorum]MDY1015686.1 TRAP transporter substrate-binding protein [Pseudomonas coleopterorum]